MAAVSFQLKRGGLSPAACPRTLSPMETSKQRAGKRFINQEYKNVRGRRQRQLMAQLRERRIKKKVLKKPAAAVRPVPRPGNRHRKYPCCGRRKERCVCDWSGIEARLDSAAWGAFLRRLEQAELKYAGALVVEP